MVQPEQSITWPQIQTNTTVTLIIKLLNVKEWTTCYNASALPIMSTTWHYENFFFNMAHIFLIKNDKISDTGTLGMSDNNFSPISDMPMLSKHLISDSDINAYWYRQQFFPKTAVNILGITVYLAKPKKNYHINFILHATIISTHTISDSLPGTWQ